MAGSHSLFFLACLCLARDLVFCSEYEETGKAITLTPSIRGKPAEILWKHNGNKVLEYDGSELLEYSPFRGRVVVDFETGQLTIRELNRQDSGQYQSDFIINEEIQTFSHTLTVLDVLAEPQVTCELDKSSKVKNLLCSVESQTPLSYEWSGPTITAQSGPELRVEEQEENQESVFTCTVKNPANSKSTSFNLRDCPADGAGAAVIISAVIGVLLLLILIIVLVVLLYKCKQKSRQSDVRKMDPENGEGQNLLKNDDRRPMPGSSEATLPCHNRLPAQKESIADKKWDQAKEFEISGQQSFSESNPEDTGNGNEREREENEENNKRSVEAKENPCTKPETEKERPNSLQSQDEENEKTPILKQESANGENEQKPEDDNEHNQKPGETAEETCRRDTGEDQTLQRNDPPDLMTAVDQPLDGGAPISPVRSFLHSRDTQFRIGSSEATLTCHNRLPAQKESIADKKWDQAKELENSGQQSFSESNQEDTENGNEREDEENNKIALKAKEIACSNPDETEKERQNSLKSQDEESEKSPMLKQESANEEKSPEHQKEPPEEQKAEDDIEDKQMPAEGTCGRDAESESLQSAVKEGSTTDTDNEEEQVHEDEEKSQSDDLEQQNESLRNPEDDMRPGERKERSEEKDHEGIDRANPTCDRPAVDQPLDGGARGSPVRSFLHSQPMQFRIGSSEATLTCHNRLPAQKESIADKKWDQAKELENSGQQSFSESNQEDTENGNERENEENNKIALKAKEIACSKPDETEKERQNSLQSQDEENKKSPMLKQESANEEKSPEHQKETPEEQKAEDDIEDKQMPAEGMCGRDAESESPQSAVKEGSTTDTDNEEKQVHEDEEKSQSDDRELEQQNESPRNPEDDMRPGERKERSEEKDHEGIDGANTNCDRPAVDQPSIGEAPSSPALSFLYSRREPFRFDSPANVKETINVSPANPTDPTDNTDQNKEETTSPRLEQDEKDKVATNQEQKDVKEQMSEGKDPEPEMSEETDD